MSTQVVISVIQLIANIILTGTLVYVTYRYLQETEKIRKLNTPLGPKILFPHPFTSRGSKGGGAVKMLNGSIINSGDQSTIVEIIKATIPGTHSGKPVEIPFNSIAIFRNKKDKDSANRIIDSEFILTPGEMHLITMDVDTGNEGDNIRPEVKIRFKSSNKSGEMEVHTISLTFELFNELIQ